MKSPARRVRWPRRFGVLLLLAGVACTDGGTGVVAVASVDVRLPAGAPANLKVGETLQLAVTARDADGNALTGRNVVWVSLTPALASITATGLLTALAAGEARVSAEVDGRSGSLTLTIIPAVELPGALTSPASDIGFTTATLNGVVQPNGGPTTVTFEFGATTALGGQCTPIVVPASTTSQPLQCAVTGLTPASTYYYRLSAINSAGTTNGEKLTVTTPTPTADQVMAWRPFVPTDFDLVDPFFYPQASLLAPAQRGEYSEAEARSTLLTHLQAMFPANPVAVQDGMAVFDSPRARQLISSPPLRAALAALKGTVAEAAIDFYLNATTPSGLPKVGSVRWQEGTVDVWAEVRIFAGDVIEVWFSPRYLGEHPLLLASLVAHEALHQDATSIDDEEVFAHAVGSLVHLQLIALHPGLAVMGTELTQDLNTGALARLNGGEGSVLGLLATNGQRPVLPESRFSNSSFASFIADFGPPVLPGSALLAELLAVIQRPGTATCPNEFSLALLACMDERGSQGPVTSEHLVRAAEALDLDLYGNAGTSAEFRRHPGAPGRTIPAEGN